MKNFFLFFLLSFFVEDVFGQSLSVKEGDSVTLHTGLTIIQKDDVLQWRFGRERDRIAILEKDSEATIEDNVLGGIFRGRLKPDGQTGDLTITNITTEQAGPYEISINIIPSRTFSVIVVSADPVKSVSLMVGDSVTLNTGVPEPQRYDVIQWRFGHQNSPIAEINRKTEIFSTYDVPDGRFKDRLHLDYKTGSLTIKKTETKHSGDYEVDISSSNHTIHKSFTVTVSDAVKSVLSVMEGESVTLNSDLTEIQKDDFMQWTFRDSQIAGIHKADKLFSTSDDRLKLDHQTGSLTITNTRNTDSGLYELKISNSRRTIHRRITVTVTGPGLSPGAIAAIVGVVLLLVCAAATVIYQRCKISELKLKALRTLAVMEGESVTLIPNGIEIPKDKDIRWRFGGATIAERKGSDRKITVNDDVLEKIFKDRLLLDKGSGFLSITNIKTTNSGHYELWSDRSGMKPLKTLYVSVYDKTEIQNMSVKEGDTVTLKTGVPDIKKDDEILWKFGLYETPIALITGGTKTISHFAAGWRFIFKLELDHQTGSLTIKKIRTKHTGFYVLFITIDGKTTMNVFNVKHPKSTHNRNNPEEKTATKNNPEESVPLSVNVLDITDSRNNPKKKIPRGDAFDEFPDSRL